MFQKITIIFCIVFLIENRHLNKRIEYNVSMFYCGFSGEYCGQSNSDDINEKVDIVILAFANTNADGSIRVDEKNFPSLLVNKWKGEGKKVLISVGGQKGNWENIFATQKSLDLFAKSVTKYIKLYNLDGVDLDIQNYKTPPAVVSESIKVLRTELDTLQHKKLIVLSPECVGVYQGTKVQNPHFGGNYWNYFVSIIKEVGHLIDFYQPQAYNNWYGFPAGSLNYLKQVYLNWRNLQGLAQGYHPIKDFQGVPGQKLLLGVLASPKAGESTYYYTPQILSEFKQFLAQNNYKLYGFMEWDSHWDKQNNFAITNQIAK